MRALLAALACASVCACSRTQEAPPSPPATPPAVAAQEALTPKQLVQAQLMAAVFGKQYRAATGDALAELTDSDNRKTRSQYVVTPLAYTALPNGHTVLVANAEMAGSDGKAESGHASPGLLNVFFLKPNGAQWQVVKRHENIDTLGAYGRLGSVSWVELGRQKPGMAISSGDSGQGYSIGFLSLFDLSADTPSDLTGTLSIDSDNEGACSPTTSKCWLVEGKWRLVRADPAKPYDDLIIDFSGYSAVPKATGQTQAEEQAEELDDIERVKIALGSKARYAFDGKKYRLVEGENIVPGI